MNDHEKIISELASLRTIVENAQAKMMEARDEAAELQSTFDLVWKAQMRAIKRWQEATGRELVWPDQADLCVWLLEQLDERDTLVTELKDESQDLQREVAKLLSEKLR